MALAVWNTELDIQNSLTSKPPLPLTGHTRLGRVQCQGGIKGAITARSGRIKPAGVRITGPSPATCTNQSTGGSTGKKKKDK